MSEINFEYAKGRYINPKKIIELSVYSKSVPGTDNPSEYRTVWRVALTIDVQNKENSTMYSDPYATEAEANSFAKTVPLS
jgi:hypothetical protein